MAMSLNASVGRPYADINLTPLIDVMLVLLIIFIMTIPKQTHAVKVDNPSATLRTGVPPEIIDLSIDFDGTLRWNNVSVDRTALQRYIGQAAAKAPQPEVRISVDKFAKYEVVAQTMADLQHRGLSKIGFVSNDGL